MAADTIVRPDCPPCPEPTARRLLPAGLASMLSHAVLFAVFFLLMPDAPADTPTERALPADAILTAEPADDARRDDPFLADVVNDGSKEFQQNPADDLERIGKVTIPGQVNPLEDPGLKQGDAETIFRDFPHPRGFGERGAGGGLEIPDKQPTTSSPFDPGGYASGGFPEIRDVLKGRSAVTRERLVIRGGGTGKSEVAVTAGLKWLAQQQIPDGSWRLDGNFPDKATTANDIAATALGLLPFLGAGKTHRAAKDNPYDKPIERALLYLIRKQDKRTGSFGGGMYGHGLATIAVCEAYGLTQDPALRLPAQRAVNFIVSAQHDAGGWRYTPGQAGDTSVSGWQIMALKSAEMAGLDVSPLAMKKAQRYLDACVSPSDEGYGYVGRGSTPTMTAVGLLCRQFMQSWGPQNIRLIRAVDLHLKPNQPGAKRDAYYLYYATQVMFHFGGESWRQWNARMLSVLLDAQDASSSQKGSWSSAGDVHGAAGGRLMVTSLNLLTLEVYYRHLPLYQRNATGEMARK